MHVRRVSVDLTCPLGEVQALCPCSDLQDRRVSADPRGRVACSNSTNTLNIAEPPTYYTAA